MLLAELPIHNLEYRPGFRLDLITLKFQLLNLKKKTKIKAVYSRFFVAIR